MARKWLVGANAAALVVWAVSWLVPVGIALPQGGPMPNRWNVFVLAMQVHPWEAIVPITLCFDIAFLAQVFRRS